MMHRALASWAIQTIGATDATMPDVVRDGLRELGEALGATRVLYFGFRAGDAIAVVEVDWAAPGQSSAVGAEYAEAEVGELFTILRAGEIVSCDVDRDEPALSFLRGILQAEGLVSDLVIPLVVDGRLRRAVVIDFAERPAASTEELLALGGAVRALLAATEQRIEREQAQRAREQALHQKQKLQSLGIMAGGILHDVNNVFQIVLGLSDLLLDEPSATRRNDIAGNICDAVERGAELCHRILVFSRQEHRTREALDVAEVLSGLEPVLRSSVPEDRRLRVHAEVSAGTVYMPRVELEQALINLCNNAVDATRSGDGITIYAGGGADPSRVCLSVSDTGAGMGPEELARATEAFFTTKPAGAGTGLGLAMVQRAVEDAGGTVTLESTAGHGTTVLLRLPRHSGPVLAPPQPLQSVGGDETILLVEDDAMVLRVTASNLRRRGYTVRTARDGAEALGLYSREAAQIALVVTDVIMPKLGGVALYERIAGISPSPPPFLFTTGYDAGRLTEGFAPAPGRGVLLKPYSARVLMQRVRELLDGV